MTPEHIRDFRRETHHLRNMGMVAALPRSETLEWVLSRMDGILNGLHRDIPAARRPFPAEADLPAPRWLPEAEIHLTEYPHRNPEQLSPLLFTWRPERTLTLGDEALLGLFLSIFAGDSTTNLYRAFVESETREIDLGTKGISAWASGDQGHPVYVHLTDVVPSRATRDRRADARALLPHRWR